ncbi:hypothetical protein TNCV_4889601 [Trichonephila clavipes]|nr:hypothetical protein TNCV_4889601 [Trichonephila clavipes]
MVEHLVMGLKTSPNHIGVGSALETGGWQFIDQHGYMRRLNQVNLSGFHRSQAKGAIVPFHLFTPLLQSASLFINPSPCCTPHIKFDGTFLSIHHLAAHPTSGERH